MEVRLVTIVLAILAITYTWVGCGKNRAGYLLLSTIYFLLVIGFNVLSIVNHVGLLPNLEVTEINFVSQVVRIVGIITVAVYVGMPRRVNGLG